MTQSAPPFSSEVTIVRSDRGPVFFHDTAGVPLPIEPSRFEDIQDAWAFLGWIARKMPLTLLSHYSEDGLEELAVLWNHGGREENLHNALQTAPEDDEPLDAEERDGVAKSRESARHGHTMTTAELRDRLRAEPAQKTLTVAELLRALASVPADTEVVVRAWDDANDYCGGISATRLEYAHTEDERPFFAIDCGPDEDG